MFNCSIALSTQIHQINYQFILIRSKEAAILKANGVNIIIALGHSGLITDRLIAEKCLDVDIVVGGHSHTFLYSGTQPSTEKAEGPYPTVVTRSNGIKVPVVQAYAYTKYLGYMKLSVSAIITPSI